MQRQIWRHASHERPPIKPPTATSGQIQVSLEIVRGRARQRMRPVENPTFLIGMADDCDLVLGDPQFPEVHAYIRISEGQVTLRHLGFAPAVTVNGGVVTQHPLADGDRIRTGPYEFQVHIQPTAADDDQTDKRRSLRLPAMMDRVEDEVGNGLVQRLLSEIRHEVMPKLSRLKLFVAPETAQERTPSTANLQEQRPSYARSS